MPDGIVRNFGHNSLHSKLILVASKKEVYKETNRIKFWEVISRMKPESIPIPYIDHGKIFKYFNNIFNFEKFSSSPQIRLGIYFKTRH